MVHEFQSGSNITAHDYNELIADLNQIYGLGNGDSGYGGNSANVVDTSVDLPSISIGDVVENEQWLDLRNAMDDCALHQDTTLPNDLPLLTNLEDGDEIGFGPDAAPLFESLNGTPPNNVTELTTNRLNSDILNFETTTKLSSTRNTAWGTGDIGEPETITHEFTISFNDTDHARYFFNTGGELQIVASRTGGLASPQNQAWTDLLTNAGAIIISSAEYFGLTSSFVELTKIYASTSTTYGDPDAIEADKNAWTISLRRDDAAGINGGNGSIIRIKSEFFDGFEGPTQDALGPPSGVPVGGLPDLVDGIFTSAVNQKRSDTIFDIPTAAFANIVTLDA